MEQDAGEYGHPCGSRIQQHHRHGGSAQLDGDLQRTEKHADAQHTEKAEEQRVLHRDARPAADARLGKKADAAEQGAPEGHLQRVGGSARGLAAFRPGLNAIL